MKKILSFLMMAAVALSIAPCIAGTWAPIQLPNKVVVPTQDTPGNCGNVYATQFPTDPLIWEKNSECHTYTPTSISWISNLENDVKGFSFKGLVYKLPELGSQGSPMNAFSVFFHENRCYRGGSEYGWAFTESRLPKAYFYTCLNCNLKGTQKWDQWPAAPGGYTNLRVIEGDAAAIMQALENSAIYRYWNIKITPTGDFRIELVDPMTYKLIYVVLQNPDWQANLFDVPGYITINAKKEAETTIEPAPIIYVDDVKIWK